MALFIDVSALVTSYAFRFQNIYILGGRARVLPDKPFITLREYAYSRRGLRATMVATVDTDWIGGEVRATYQTRSSGRELRGVASRGAHALRRTSRRGA